MFLPLNSLQRPVTDSPDNLTVSRDADQNVNETALRQSAQDFEAAYIAQMLTFSGLDKALMAGGGEEVAAFTSFYIENFAEQIAEKGGFGLADKFYDRMHKLSGFTSEQNDSKNNGVLSNVDFGKL